MFNVYTHYYCDNYYDRYFMTIKILSRASSIIDGVKM